MHPPVPLRSTRRRFPVRRDSRGLSRFERRACYLLAFATSYVACSFLGVYAQGCLLLLLIPAVFGAGVGRVITDLRDARTLRRLQGTPPGLRRLRRA